MRMYRCRTLDFRRSFPFWTSQACPARMNSFRYLIVAFISANVDELKSARRLLQDEHAAADLFDLAPDGRCIS